MGAGRDAAEAAVLGGVDAGPPHQRCELWQSGCDVGVGRDAAEIAVLGGIDAGPPRHRGAARVRRVDRLGVRVERTVVLSFLEWSWVAWKGAIESNARRRLMERGCGRW